MSDENQAQEIFDQVMNELADEAAGAKPRDSASDESTSETSDAPKIDIRGDAGYHAKAEFGKKTTYIPSDGHSVWKILADAKELCTEAANLEAMKVDIGLTFVYDFISKNVYAHILKPNRLLKMHSGYNLILEISGMAWDRMTETERLALLHHELEHIRFKEKRNGDLELQLVDHTLKDFHNIIDLYGLFYIRPGLNED